MALHISEQAVVLIEKYGFHLVEMPNGSKRPTRDRWQEETICTAEHARRVWSGEKGEQLNMGVVLGKSRIASLDIDDPDAAAMIFAEFGIDIEEYRKHSPVVQGSEGCYRVMFRIPEGVEIGKKIIQWPTKEDPSKTEVVLELRSGNSQDVLPPSLHPSGRSYVWLTKPNGSIPELPEDILTLWRNWEVFVQQATALCPWAPDELIKRITPKKYTEAKPKLDSVSKAWNDQADLRTTLNLYGYVQKGKRFLSPHSTTKLPGVSIFEDGQTCWIHHASDPLCSNNKGQPRSSFDFYAYYEHRGDYKEATKAAAKLLGIEYKNAPPVYIDHPVKKDTETLPDGPPDEFGTAEHLWVEMGLRTNSRGEPLVNLDNITRILSHYPVIKKKVWYDEFLQRVLTTWGNPSGKTVEWSDEMDILLTIYLQRELGLPKIALTTVQQAVQGVAFINRRNECREWLESLVWDGTERLKDLIRVGFGAEDSQYSQDVGRCWLVSVVKRVIDPGCKVDYMPVFEGKQGIRKSSALAILGGKWFAECHEDIFSKDFYGVLQGKMIVEIAEMHAFSKADVNRIKGIISCRVDRYRAPYGRRATDNPRQSVFAGTTNMYDWNRDETGARRFWPIACTAVDQQWLFDNRDQLFAEAYARALRGESWWDVDEDQAKTKQEDRRQSDTWEDVIAKYIESRDRTRVFDVLETALQIDAAKQTKADQTRVATALRVLGWESRTVRKGSKVERWWMPGDSTVTDESHLI